MGVTTVQFLFVLRRIEGRFTGDNGENRDSDFTPLFPLFAPVSFWTGVYGYSERMNHAKPQRRKERKDELERPRNKGKREKRIMLISVFASLFFRVFRMFRG